MIFESLWPLAFLLAIPVVVILYLLVPKGTDTPVSSNLLWKKLFYNEQSKTFWEKFLHNLLMYLQIVILLLLILALMAPFVQRKGTGSTDVVYLIDTSGSMKHLTKGGNTRLGEAVSEIKEQIAASDGAKISIVTCDGTGTNLLAVHTSEKKALYRTLADIKGTDTAGSLSDALATVQTVQKKDKKNDLADVIVYTDGIGAKQTKNLKSQLQATIRVVGSPVSNVANTFLSCTKDSRGDTYTVASGVTNYSDHAANMEITLYEGKKILEVRTLSLAADETYTCLFKQVNWGKQPLHTELSAVTFAGSSQKDSLHEDNCAYALKDQVSTSKATLIGEGNTYIEKAYLAVTGENLSKAKTTDALDRDDPGICIFDADTAVQESNQQKARMIFAKEGKNEEKNVSLSAGDTELTSGIRDFALGVNQTYVYDLPVWATGFLWNGKQCAAYYGEHDGIREVVLGFDLRESDFALQPEFPVFMNHALHYLEDSSLLSQNVYDAGDTVQFHALNGVDVQQIAAPTDQAGLFTVKAGGRKESYIVKFACSSQSDGRITAGDSGSRNTMQRQLVRKQMRNVILILVLLLMILEWICYVRQMRYRGRFYLAVRLVGLALLVLAVCGISVPLSHAKDTTVFLVDLSESNAANLTQMEQYMSRQVKDMPKNNQYAIVTFGANAVVEQFLTSEKHSFQILSAPEADATNLEEAVSTGLSMIPDNAAGRLVVLTDGKQTKGNIEHTASALTAKNVQLYSVLYEDTKQGSDAYIENVEMPEYLYPGDSYSMTVTVESNYETDAKLQLLQGTEMVSQTGVHLNKGSNRFVLKQKVVGTDAQQYTVRVKAPKDTCEKNNDYGTYATVDSLPKILLVSGMGEDSTPFLGLLDAAGCNYRQVSAVSAPDTLKEMLQYKSIILENVYRTDLPEGFLKNLKTYVKDYGCGLVACGGEDSFALGGYLDTELEKLLPVDMQLRGVNEKQNLAMVMVIDHSGSMSEQTEGGTNLDLAIAAAKAAVDQLDTKDEVGVVTFDDGYTWQVPLEKVKDKDKIHQSIETISEGGGTTIKPAVRAALNEIKKSKAQLKHIVLLTDGQGETGNFEDIIKDCKDADVTLSTVAVGESSDRQLLERLATQCNGRYYYSDISTDIPKIFAQEVFLNGDTYLQNGQFSLKGNRSNAITKNLFADGWPQIKGYVSASPKTGANVLLASAEKDDPILSVMQYGLGHTVAWNTDVTNRWTAGLAQQNDYVQLWKRIIDYSAGNTALGEDRVDVTTVNGTTKVTYYAKDYAEQTQVEAVYTDPDGKTHQAKLTASAPGTYEAQLDTTVSGVYNLSVQRKNGKKIENALTTAAVVQYSQEYKFALTNDSFCAFIKQYGKMLSPKKNVWKKLKASGRARVCLTNPLLILLLFVFLADIAMRRFAYVPPMPHWTKPAKKAIMTKEKTAEDGQPEPEAEKPKEKTKKAKPEETASQALDTSALLKKKEKRNHSV